MRALLIALAFGLFSASFSLNAQAVDPATLPKIKISKLGSTWRPRTCRTS
jgi:hypothetical protein